MDLSELTWELLDLRESNKKLKGALNLLMADPVVRGAAEAQWLCLLNGDYEEGTEETPLIKAIEAGLAIVPEVYLEYSEKQKYEKRIKDLEDELAHETWERR